MEFVKENAGVNSVKFTITLSKDEWIAANNKAYEKNKSKFSVQGFRKGKVPKKVLEGMYGPGFLYEEAINEALPVHYGEALEKSPEVFVVDRPEIDLVEVNENTLVFTATVTVKPEVKLGAYKDLEIKKNSYPVSDEDVDAEIKRAQDGAGRLVDVEGRACETGDTVVIDFSGSVNGVKFEGGTAEKYSLELGSNSFIPGFEDQVAGMEIGAEKTIKVTFPETYGEASLAGKEADFEIKLHEIKKKELPALDDEFAKDVSKFDTFEEYKADVKKNLEESAQARAEQELENDLFKAVVDNVEVEIPECMIEEQTEESLQQFKYRLMYQGLKFEDYLKFSGQTEEDIKKQYHDSSRENVKTRLTMEKLIEVENLEVTDADVDAKLAEIAKSAEKDLEEYKKTVNERQIDYIKNDLIYTKLVDFLKGANKII